MKFHGVLKDKMYAQFTIIHRDREVIFEKYLSKKYQVREDINNLNGRKSKTYIG